ncbi:MULTISPECIES: hypothetical protein [Alcaligenes]|uniref:hypothetical protein n=1 Tax=Alcaligenes TaxID=507 RepID=UPI00214F6D53|nr:MULTISPECIES: hypothetical protein [Alcaligenes]MCR4142964.1 hypothetical protein [Alcaligenes faecalis]
MVTPPGSLAFYILSFRVLVCLHGAALLFIMLMGTGAIGSVFVPALLRLPLFVFLMGLVSAFLALCWSHWTLAWHSSKAGRRWAWIPGFCSAFFLALSLALFVIGVWGTLGLADFAYQHSEWLTSGQQDYDGFVVPNNDEAQPYTMPYRQHP